MKWTLPPPAPWPGSWPPALTWTVFRLRSSCRRLRRSSASKKGKPADQLGALHRHVQPRAAVQLRPAGKQVLQQGRQNFGADQPVFMQGPVLALLKPQRRAPDEQPLQLFGIAGILQPQPLQGRLQRFRPPGQHPVQQLGHAFAVDPADAAVDKGIEVAKNDPLRQHVFKPVRRQPAQQHRHPQAVVQRQRQAEAAAIGQHAPRPPAVAGAALGSGRLRSAGRRR